MIAIETHIKKAKTVFRFNNKRIIYNQKGRYVRYKDLELKDIKKVVPLDQSPTQFCEQIFVDMFRDYFKSDSQNNVAVKNDPKLNFDIAIERFKQEYARRVEAGILKHVTVRTNLAKLSYVEEFLKSQTIKNITTKKIDDWLNAFAGKKGIDLRNRVRIVMNDFFSFCITTLEMPIEKHLMLTIKNKKVPNEQKKEIKYWESGTKTFEQLVDCSNIADATNDPKVKVWKEYYNSKTKTLLYLLKYTGARISEIRDIRWDDITYARKGKVKARLLIRNAKEGAKKGMILNEKSGTRIIDVHPNLLAVLLAHKKLMEKERALKLEIHSKTGKFYKSIKTDPINDVVPKQAKDSDYRNCYKWEWVIASEYGDKPDASTIRGYYNKIFKATYDKYKDDTEHPWLHGKKPDGLGFHSWRHNYITTLIDGNASLRSVQSLVGHKVGSPVTMGIYYHMKDSKAADEELSDLL